MKPAADVAVMRQKSLAWVQKSTKLGFCCRWSKNRSISPQESNQTSVHTVMRRNLSEVGELPFSTDKLQIHLHLCPVWNCSLGTLQSGIIQTLSMCFAGSRICKCGNRLMDDAEYCRKCGAAVTHEKVVRWAVKFEDGELHRYVYLRLYMCVCARACICTGIHRSKCARSLMWMRCKLGWRFGTPLVAEPPSSQTLPSTTLRNFP